MLIAGIVLTGIALVLLLWLPAINRFRLGNAVLVEDDEVNVRCPECGYSLIGMTHLRCPECGAQFTIDDLIHRQNYQSTPNAAPPPEPGPLARASEEDATSSPAPADVNARTIGPTD